jgi:protein-S-isoprenylcysteine O-methyltransferase Ste14
MTGLRIALVDVSFWCLRAVGLVWIIAAVYFAVRRPGTAGQKVVHVARTFLPEPWLLLLVPALSVLVATVPATLWRDLTYWSPVLALPGLLCVLASTAFMCWARWSIGAMWAGRPLVQQEHDLCTDGPYRLVRHPIYTGFAGLALGCMLVLGFGRMLAVVLATVAFVGWRIRVEEGLMIAAFGDRYRRYRREVPALVPRLLRPGGRERVGTRR